MIAKDAGLFRKQDLDVDLVFMGSSALIIQSMLSGAVPVAGVAGPAVISSVVGGGDVVTVANLAPLTIALMVKPSIEKPEDLKGKKIGVPRLGAVAHFAIRMILDRHGIKDAAILQMGSQPEAAAGMRKAGDRRRNDFATVKLCARKRRVSPTRRSPGLPQTRYTVYFPRHLRAKIL